MAKKTGGTYQLKLSDEAFAILTEGLLLYQRQQRKLQGFGQFINHLLNCDNHCVPRHLPSESMTEAAVERIRGDIVIWLAVDQPNIALLQNVRTDLSEKSGFKIETAEALTLLVHEFVTSETAPT